MNQNSGHRVFDSTSRATINKDVHLFIRFRFAIAVLSETKRTPLYNLYPTGQLVKDWFDGAPPQGRVLRGTVLEPGLRLRPRRTAQQKGHEALPAYIKHTRHLSKLL